MNGQGYTAWFHSTIPFVLVSCSFRGLSFFFFANRSIPIHPPVLLCRVGVFVVGVGVAFFSFYFNLHLRGLGWDGKSFTWSFYLFISRF